VMPADAYEVICEVEPATRPDLMGVRHQIGVLSRVATGFLIPDNHIGRATVSSLAVAHEVSLMGGRAIACINARDRNVLGFRRDLLTAAAYGVDELLFVYGDRPETGKRSDDLTVAAMVREARAFAAQHEAIEPFRIAVSCGLGPVPAWKLEADALYVQVSYSVDQLCAWRSGLDFDGPVYAGVMVLASAAMANKLSKDVPQLAVPDRIRSRLEADPTAGVAMACDLITAIRDSEVFAGAHVIPISRYRELATQLEPLL
jgi:methylenetetrahydrofolate reductase (NADPH)